MWQGQARARAQGQGKGTGANAGIGAQALEEVGEGWRVAFFVIGTATAFF